MGNCYKEKLYSRCQKYDGKSQGYYAHGLAAQQISNNHAVEYAVEYNDFNIDDIDFECDSLPKTVDELKAQIRISEEQIKRGECVTAQEAIKHFYSL